MSATLFQLNEKRSAAQAAVADLGDNPPGMQSAPGGTTCSSWTPPLPEDVTLNCDASFLDCGKLAGLAVLCRNQFLLSINGKTCRCLYESAVKAEALAYRREPVISPQCLASLVSPLNQNP